MRGDERGRRLKGGAKEERVLGPGPRCQPPMSEHPCVTWPDLGLITNDTRVFLHLLRLVSPAAGGHSIPPAGGDPGRNAPLPPPLPVSTPLIPRLAFGIRLGKKRSKGARERGVVGGTVWGNGCQVVSDILEF